MPELRIKELEEQLVTANQNVTRLTQTNLELTKGLADAELAFKKLKKSARRDESTFKEQISAAQMARRS